MPIPIWAAALLELCLIGWGTFLIYSFRVETGKSPSLIEIASWYLFLLALWLLWGPGGFYR